MIDQLLPASRRGNANTYCQSLTAANMSALNAATDINGIIRAVSPGTGSDRTRYVKLNFTAFWRHGTVEFRQHSGTIDAAKIIKWVILCSKMVETAVREAGQPIVGQPIAAPATPETQQYSYEGYSPHWRERGRRTAVMFQMLRRPQGVTARELQIALGVTTRPDIMWHQDRAHDPLFSPSWNRSRMRGGTVYRLRDIPGVPAPAPTPNPVAVQPTAPVSLEGLYEKLGLSEEDKLFWAARAAMLAQPHARTGTV